MSTAVAELLDELKQLCYDDRVRRMVALGRDVANEPFILELEQGDSFARRMAAYSCYSSRNSERVVRFASDQSRLLRGIASKLAPFCCDGDQLATVFLGLRGRYRREFLVSLRKRRRFAEVDSLCRLVLDREGSWIDVITYGSAALIAEAWPSLENPNTMDWTRLARSQPEFAFNEMRKAVAREAGDTKSLRVAINLALAFATPFAPDAALELVRTFVKFHPLKSVATKWLLPFKPEELAQLVLEFDGESDLNFSKYVPRLRPETLDRLLAERPELLPTIPNYLKKLGPDRRTAIYEKYGRGWQATGDILPSSVLSMLPQKIRHAETRRYLNIPSFAAQPERWLFYVPFLTWDEARVVVEPLLRDPDPAYRGMALSVLGRLLRFERQRAGEFLQMVHARPNEQDPVRSRVWLGLVILPPSTWKPDHLPVLSDIVQQALNAKNLSGQTASAIEKFVVRLLPLYPEWSGDQLQSLYQIRGEVTFISLQERIDKEQMKIIGPRILPVFEAWCRQEKSPFIGAMKSLGSRIKDWDEGAQLLVEVARSGPVKLAENAIELLAAHRPDIMTWLVPELLKDHSSSCTVWPVCFYLHRKRQDLLDEVSLGRQEPDQRFWSGQTKFDIPVKKGFDRWAPQQQEMFALSLAELVNDGERDVLSARLALMRWCELPDVDTGPLLEFASGTTGRPALREAVMYWLYRLDRGQGVPALLDAMNDDGARIAIYGLRRSLLEMPPVRAIEMLREVPLQKVTVAKEVVRLLGDLPDPAALELLLEIHGRKLHRDVEVAVIRALWGHLDDDRTWPILEKYARSEDPALARTVARTTALRMTSAIRVRLNRIFAAILEHPEVRVRMAVLENAREGGIYDPEEVLLPNVLNLVRSEARVEYLAAALTFWKLYALRRPELGATVIRQALPNRIRLHTLVIHFIFQAKASPRLSKAAGLAIIEALADDPVTVPLRIEVASEISWEAFASQLREASNDGQLHYEAVQKAVLQIRMSRFNLAGLANIEAELFESPAPELRRIALEILIKQGGVSQGWTEERMERLLQYRRDPDSMVAYAAQWKFIDALDEAPSSKTVWSEKAKTRTNVP